MLVPAINVDCLLFKLVSILDIFVPTLVLPYNKLVDAVIVAEVIVVLVVLPKICPQVIAPTLRVVDVVSDACFPLNVVSIPEIFV